MKIKYQKKLRHQLTASLFFAISAVSFSGQCASISYNHTIHFDQGMDFSPLNGSYSSAEGYRTCAYGGCPTMSINFTFDTDTHAIGNVSSLGVPSDFERFQNDPFGYMGADIISGAYRTSGSSGRTPHFWTAYLVNNSLDPLSLVSISSANVELVGHLGIGNNGYYATSQTLTNLSSFSNVPLPPALLMFASSCLGLGLVGSKRKNIMCR